MTKYLEHVAESNEFTTKGVKYEVLREDARCYYIEIDSGARAMYTKEPDSGGASYKTWFKLVEEAEAIETVIENVTVLTDELGLDREYLEVKRNANVGERIKVVRSEGGDSYPKVGDIGICTRNNQFSDGSIDTTLTHDCDGFIDTDRGEYVVLEPSGIIRINGERFRLVERKAAVGERVVIVNAVDDSLDEYGYSNGQIYEVVSLEYVDRPNIRPDGTESSEIFLEHKEYRILESLTPATNTEPHVDPTRALVDALIDSADKLAVQLDGALDTIANLARRLTKTESELVKVKRTADTAESNLGDLADRERNLRIRLNRIEGKAEKTVTP